jgi:hypothetical protein
MCVRGQDGAGVEWSSTSEAPGAGLASDRSRHGSHDNRDGPLSAKSISRALRAAPLAGHRIYF